MPWWFRLPGLNELDREISCLSFSDMYIIPLVRPKLHVVYAHNQMGACVSSGTPVASSTSSSRFPRWRRQRVFSACVRSTRPALLFFDGRHWQVDVPRLRVGVQRLRVESMNRVPPVRTQGGDSIHRVHFTHFNDDDERTQLHIVGSFADSASQASVPNSYTGDVFLLRCQGGDLVLLTQVTLKHKSLSLWFLCAPFQQHGRLLFFSIFHTLWHTGQSVVRSSDTRGRFANR